MNQKETPICKDWRFLFGAGKSRPNELYFGQDLDRKCCLMTVLNLFANDLSGEVVWGDTLLRTEERTWDCWNINTVGKGIHRIPITESYIFQSQQNLMARNRAEKQKPKIDFGKIDLPSEHRQKPVGKTVQSGLF